MINDRLIRSIILAILLSGSTVFSHLWAAPKIKPAAPAEQAFLSKNDRILILAPHPDDEILCCGGLLQRAQSMHLPIKIVYLTNGDSNEWSFLLYYKRPVIVPRAVLKMGEVRQQEAMAATEALEIPENDLIFLGYPDFGMLNIWNTRWDNSAPFRSILTKVTAVPYKTAFRTGAPHKGEEVLKDLETILRDFKPTKIFVSHPADHNSDHRAFYLFTKVALWDLATEINPKVYPYLVHWKRWPIPLGYRPQEILKPPPQLEHGVHWDSFSLSPEETTLKEQALKAHTTQYISSRRYLESFIRSNELFGDYAPLRLGVNKEAKNLSPPGGTYNNEPPPQLSDEEKAFFVGTEQRSVRLQDDYLILTIKFSRNLAKEVGLSVYLFGYRPDRAFGEMPKIHLNFGTMVYSISNQRERMSPEFVKIKRGSDNITVEIPLYLLGNPTKILASAQTFIGKLPVDAVFWRTIEIMP